MVISALPVQVWLDRDVVPQHLLIRSVSKMLVIFSSWADFPLLIFFVPHYLSLDSWPAALCRPHCLDSCWFCHWCRLNIWQMLIYFVVWIWGLLVWFYVRWLSRCRNKLYDWLTLRSLMLKQNMEAVRSTGHKLLIKTPAAALVQQTLCISHESESKCVYLFACSLDNAQTPVGLCVWWSVCLCVLRIPACPWVQQWGPCLPPRCQLIDSCCNSATDP